MKIEQYWGIIYAIMKSLGVKELEIDKKYFEIDINKFVNMYYHDTLNGNIKVELREKNNEVEEEKKIPEKLDYCEENTFMIKCKENSYLTREEIRLLDSNFKELGNKINSIIDYLKSKGE